MGAPRSLLDETLREIGAPDEGAIAAARLRQGRLTKPPSSLGRLEQLSIQLAGVTGQLGPSLARRAVIVMAADHGITAEGVSPYPSIVTAQMVANFLAGGAAINVLAREVGARVTVVDIGLAHPVPGDAAGLARRPVGQGTANMAVGPAMSQGQARSCVEVGIDLLGEVLQGGLDLVATGDMGIGNTSAAAAITAVMTGRPPGEVTGPGTGLDGPGLLRKVQVVERALAVNRPHHSDPMDVLTKVGGFEIGGLAGVMLAAAARRLPVVIDGFISGAAALLAAGLCPRVAPYLIAGHRSTEPGHAAVLAHLGLEPVLDLDLRLGEGTGAVLAMPVVAAAAALLRDMATFEDASVADRSDREASP